MPASARVFDRPKENKDHKSRRGNTIIFLVHSGVLQSQKIVFHHRDVLSGNPHPAPRIPPCPHAPPSGAVILRQHQRSQHARLALKPLKTRMTALAGSHRRYPCRRTSKATHTKTTRPNNNHTTASISRHTKQHSVRESFERAMDIQKAWN